MASTRKTNSRCLLVAGIALTSLGLGGCHWHDDDCDDCGPGYYPDTHAPAAPRGVSSVTGDRSVEIYWVENTESDLDGYRIYRNDEPDGYFEKIGSVGYSATSYVDRSARNGQTYYYAVTAFDDYGNESELSYELVFDTPRPDGRNLRVFNAANRDRDAGYDFSAQRVVDADDISADIYYWYTEEEGAWLVATERSADEYTDIQDAGFHRMDDVGWAPDGGWSPTGDSPAIEGHVYLVWTWDNHFAKVRVVSIESDSIVLDWAYQTDRGNPELRVPNLPGFGKEPGGGDRAHRAGPGRR